MNIVKRTTSKYRNMFLNDDFIFVLILINSVTIFWEGFELSLFNRILVDGIDTVITLLFLFEAIIKIREMGWKAYIASNWNKMDFILVVLSLPSIFLIISHLYHIEVTTNLHFILVFRILRISRVFRFFRFFKFIPGIDELFIGVTRALKTSVFVIVGFGVYNFVLAILSCHLFKELAPELFGNPIKSFYNTFKIFTVEGWYEIPEKLAGRTASSLEAGAIKVYFIGILITGGILGLSLVNSIFVDSMVADNNDDLEAKVDKLNRKIDILLEMYQLPEDMKKKLDEIDAKIEK